MDLNELIILKNTKEAELLNLRTVGEAEVRELTAEENVSFNALQSEIRDIESKIESKNKNKTNNIEPKNMNNFKELLVRNGDSIENFKVRAVTLSTSIDNVQVTGGISSVGYTPFYQNMGVQILPNLTTSIKLPFVNGIVSQKPGEGTSYANDKTLATVLLQPARYTITETIGKEILAVGNESALQNYLLEMVKGCDRAVTKDIFDVAYAGATAITGITGYTATNVNTLMAGVDGEVKILMPFAEFWKAKGVVVGTASGLFLANRDSSYSGHFYDGTPLFYSQLFAPATANSVVIADLSHVTVGEFGADYEIIFDNFSKAPQGQVVITVCKLAGVVLRNTLAAKKAVIN